MDWTVVGYCPMSYKESPERIERLRMLEIESADVEFRNGAFHFRTKDIVLTGLHQVMESQFCPNQFQPPSRPSAKLEKKRMSKKRKLDRAFEVEFGYPATAFMSDDRLSREKTKEIIKSQTSSGRRQGLFVDQQCSAILRQEDLPVSSKVFRYDAECYAYWEKSELTIRPEALIKVHPFSILIFSELLTLGFEPVIAQLPVMHEKLFIATAADQIWWCESRKRFVLIEVKCDRAKHFDSLSPVPMFAPLRDLPNTPRNRAFVQLSLTKYMLERTYPATKDCLAYVLRVHSDETLAKAFPLDSDLYKLTLNCWHTARG
jgi:hypothetical protein